MGKLRHFELSEFLKSDVAKSRNIDNTPTFEIVEHIEELVDNFLEPMRNALGLPVVVSSGYRCKKLNTAVGGVYNSAHLTGYAADITCPYTTFAKFKTFVVDWAKKTGTKFDQIILETEAKSGKRWLHVGWKDSLGRQRGQILNIDK